MATSSIDLKKKLHITGEALGTNGAKALFDVLYDDYEEPQEDPVTGRIYGARRKPKKESVFDRFSRQYDGRTESTDDLDLFHRIGEQFGLGTPDRTLLECSASEFFSFLPFKLQRAVRLRIDRPENEWLKEVITAADSSAVTSDITEEFDQVIYRSLTHSFADKTDVWQEIGVVDQKFMYLNLHSVENWRALLDDKTYRPYHRCLSALTDLLDAAGSPWNKEAETVDTVVIFGAGTPEKEFLIIQNLLKQVRFSESNKLRVVIVDASVYMLVDTYVQIRKLLEPGHLDRRVEIVQCWADFNHMQPHLKRIRPETGKGRVAFFIMGGTIGNIDERLFLSSVLDISEPNDLLVVSAEFVDEAPERNEYLKEFVKDYSGDHARDLVLEPIRRLLDHKGIAGDMSKRRSMVAPKLLEDHPSLGSIPGTVGVVLRIDQHGLKLALSMSKRYEYQYFRDFFKRLHFTFLTTFPSSEFKPYQQVMFIRDAT